MPRRPGALGGGGGMHHACVARRRRAGWSRRISGRSSFSPGIRRRQETRQSQVTICLYADFRESVRRRRAAPEVLQTHYSSPAQVLFFARGCEFTLGNSIGVCSDVPLVFSGRNHFFSAPSRGARGPNLFNFFFNLRGPRN